MGLLSRASNLDEKPLLAFSDFILKHQLKTCAVLEKEDIYYTLSNSIGFDVSTITSISSTPAYWQGLCPQEDVIYNFLKKDDSISPLLQLFSFNMKDEVTELYVCRASTSKILLSCQELSQKAVEDLERLSNNYHQCNIENLNQYIKDGSNVLKFTLDLAPVIEGSDKEKNAIFSEYYNRLLCFYNKPDATSVSKNYTLKTVFIADKTFSSDLIAKHLLLNLKDITDQSPSQIKINYLGTAASCNEIKEFLQAE